ncbi:MAG: zinc ribbon domain-containing protein [Promethearchaeota archaeon]|nr:MAG: zinc ribbon domain-containing protein [Candidatus Lokiarchaeota archaeon]
MIFDMDINNLHMMDFEFSLNMWIFIIIGGSIFFIFLITLLYYLGSTTNSEENSKIITIKSNQKKIESQSSNNLEKKLYCPSCGNEIDDRSIIFCTYCGTRI